MAEQAAEQSREWAHRAAAAPHDQRAQLWQRAQSVVDAYLQSHGENRWAVLVRYQAALNRLARGELLRREAELIDGDERRFLPAREHLRAAIEQLKTVRDEIARLLPAAGQRSAAEKAELIALERDVDYQLARARRNQAASYSPGSADRAYTLNQAIGRLGPLAQLPTDHPLSWPSRIALARAYRMLGDRAKAAQALDAIDRASPPAPIAAQVLAERRLLTADGERSEGQPEAVSRHLSRYEPRDNNTAGHPQASLLLDAANDLVRRKRFDEAVDAYDRAVRVATEQGDGDTAFAAAYRAAAIAHQQGDHDAAMRRFHAIVVRWPDHEKARASHRLAIHHAGELLRAAPDDTLLDQYVTMLREHVRAWPESDEADPLRLRLGQIEAGRGRMVDAIEALAPIRPEFDDYAAVLDLLRRCYHGAEPVRRREAASPALLGRLAGAFPDDAVIQESYADALVATSRPDQLRHALKQYRVLVERSPEASPRWFRAKYAIAALHLRLGNAEQAAKIVRLLKVLHPELGGPEMRGRFDQLLNRTGRP